MTSLNPDQTTEATYPKAPPRGPLPPDIAKAARLIHRRVWNDGYLAGEGPMHHAGGPYWHHELLRLADLWEKQAAAARLCATFLPDEGR
jgi:hypothetical protein